MHIDFQPPYAWSELNDLAADTLGLGAHGGAVKLVAGPRPALAELTLGLVRQFPHRRKVYFFKGLDPMLEAPAMALAKEGCSVQGLDPQLLSQPEALTAAIEAEALMVLVSEEDPLLGRVHDLKNVEAVSEARKFFLIRVSHYHHRYLPLPTQFPRHLLRVQSLGARLALILSSARTRWPIQFAESIALPPNALEEVKGLRKQELVNPLGIERFEGAAAEFGALPVFAPEVLRVPDRAVIYFPDLDGMAVLERLAERLGLDIGPAGEPTRLETTSLHRWQGVRTMDWLRPYGFSDAMIRGTLIIDHSLLTPDIIPHLKQIRQEILQIQNG